MIEQLQELAERLDTKAAILKSMASTEHGYERSRLNGKAQGIDLAVSFVNDMIRDERAKAVSTRVDL